MSFSRNACHDTVTHDGKSIFCDEAGLWYIKERDKTILYMTQFRYPSKKHTFTSKMNNLTVADVRKRMIDDPGYYTLRFVRKNGSLYAQMLLGGNTIYWEIKDLNYADFSTLINYCDKDDKFDIDLKHIICGYEPAKIGCLKFIRLLLLLEEQNKLEFKEYQEKTKEYLNKQGKIAY